MSETAVLIVEDDQLMLKLLKRLVAQIPGCTVVALTSDGASAITEAEENKPDLVIMDIDLPGVDGITATSSIKLIHPGCHVIIASTHEKVEYVFAALMAGADGYCTKATLITMLDQAIFTVLAGATWLDPAIKQKLFQYGEYGEQSNDCKYRPFGKLGLDAGESKVLHLLVAGYNSSDTATALSLTETETAEYTRSILTKLGVSSRSQAAAIAIRTLISPE